jgi:hypothetical protein
VPLSANPKVPSLVFADEIAVQFGPEVVYDTFDQNRVFLGLKQKLSRSWSFDLGTSSPSSTGAAGAPDPDRPLGRRRLRRAGAERALSPRAALSSGQRPVRARPWYP